MPTQVLTVADDYGNERRAGTLTGTWAQIAADPNVHEFWPMHPSFISRPVGSDIAFECRPAKSKSHSMVLRPAEFGYWPQYAALGGAGFLRMGFSNNGGPVGGNLGDLHNGALVTGIDARVFPLQDGAAAFKNSYTIVAAAKAPAPGSSYPGCIAGNVTTFPDSTSVDQTFWSGLSIGHGTTSTTYAFFAGRGTTGMAASAVNRANDTWYVYSGIYDVPNGLYRLRVNGVSVASTTWPGGVATQSSSQRPGYTAMRVGSAGDIGGPIERTFVGDIGPIAVMHVAGDAPAYLASLTRIEGALMAMVA